MAIKNYQNAIQTLVQLAQLYPDYKLNSMYLQRAQLYQERVKALQSAHGIEAPPEDDSGGFNFLPPSMPSRPGTAPLKPSLNVEAKPEGPQVVPQLKANYNDLIMKEKPNVKWDEVVGLEDAKRALRESIIFPVQRPDLFPLGWPRGLLMYGPSGCGKTLLAAASASEIDSYFITVDAASIMSKWLGEGEKNVAKLFNSARKLLEKDAKSVIVFIDELDSILVPDQMKSAGKSGSETSSSRRWTGFRTKESSSTFTSLARQTSPGHSTGRSSDASRRESMFHCLTSERGRRC